MWSSHTGSEKTSPRRWHRAVVAVLASSTVAVAAEAGASSASPARGTVSPLSATRTTPRVPNPRIPAPIPPRVAPFGSGVGSAAENWSGYAQSGARGTYSAIKGSFNVPTVSTSSSGQQFSSAWLGIGGDTDSTLIQAGIEEDNLGGTALYSAWTEVLPQAEHPLRMTINPGDTITVTIVESAKNAWKITVADVSTGATASRKVRYKSSGASAEAILERPCIQSPCNTVADLASLAPTTPVTFDLLMTATSRPSSSPSYAPFMVSPGSATLQDIVMLANNGSTVIATPSDADSDGDGFVAADGSSVPSAPSS